MEPADLAEHLADVFDADRAFKLRGAGNPQHPGW